MRWQGGMGLVGRREPAPVLIRLGPDTMRLDQIQVEIQGAKSVRLRFGDLTGGGDLGISGYAEDAEQRGASFLAFFPAGRSPAAEEDS